MEERSIKDRYPFVKRVVVTGPESTGKTTITRFLAEKFQAPYVPEYAREYTEKLTRPYVYEDVLHIAEQQVLLEETHLKKASSWLFSDTDLMITKIWFIWVYGRYPAWIDQYLEKNKPDLYLLCATDLPWIPDKVRENSGVNREKLFETYKNELEKFGMKYKTIRGFGRDRGENALIALEDLR
jgi:NadR type nicotinamide-nucleotide adenylyltransferase